MSSKHNPAPGITHTTVTARATSIRKNLENYERLDGDVLDMWEMEPSVGPSAKASDLCVLVPFQTNYYVWLSGQICDACCWLIAFTPVNLTSFFR